MNPEEQVILHHCFNQLLNLLGHNEEIQMINLESLLTEPFCMTKGMEHVHKELIISFLKKYSRGIDVVEKTKRGRNYNDDFEAHNTATNCIDPNYYEIYKILTQQMRRV